MPRFAWLQPPLTATAAGWQGEIAPGEILLPSSVFGEDLDATLGTAVTVEFIRQVGPGHGVPEYMTLTVVGLYDAQSPLAAGQGAAYVAEEDFQTGFAAVLGAPAGRLPLDTVYPRAWVKTTNVSSAADVARTLAEEGYFINRGASSASLAPALQWLRQVNDVFAVVLALFGIGVGIAVAGTWAQLRRWDAGLLMSLGWSPGRILRTYCAELAIVGLVVGVASALAGTAVSAAGSALLQGREWAGLTLAQWPAFPPWPWLLAVVVGTPAALLLGALPRTLALTRVPPDEALRRPD